MFVTKKLFKGTTFCTLGCSLQGHAGSWFRAAVMSGVSTAAREEHKAFTDCTNLSTCNGNSTCKWQKTMRKKNGETNKKKKREIKAFSTTMLSICLTGHFLTLKHFNANLAQYAETSQTNHFNYYQNIVNYPDQ